MTPATGFEPGFTTSVIEESLAIPTKLRCHLRQEEAAGQTALEQNPIPAYDYLTGIDALEGRKSRDLNVRREHLVRLQRVKTRVLEGGGDRVVPDRPPQRRDADHMTDTTSKPTLNLESYKGASRFQEFLVARLRRGEGYSVQAALNRFACQREQKSGCFPVDRVLRGIRMHL